MIPELLQKDAGKDLRLDKSGFSDYYGLFNLG